MFVKNLKYYNNLDGLRGIAAISVIIFHFFHDPRVTIDLYPYIELIKKLTEILQHGVTLFFVLSGFVITRILLNTKDSNSYFIRFYKRRVLRIFPLYYLYLIIHYYIFPFITEGQINSNFNLQIPYYLYFQNIAWFFNLQAQGPGHFWSLAVEEHFYLIWPLIVFIIPNDKIKVTTILLLLISVPIKIIFLKNNIDINYNTFSRYDSIMLGCFIAILERKSNYILKPINIKLIAIISLTILSFGFLIYIFQDSFPFFKSSSKHIILSLFFGLLIYYLVAINKDNLVNQFLCSKLMQYLGKISYGLYVWHMLAIALVSLLSIKFAALNLLLVFFITLVFSHLSYFYFEKLFLKFK